MKPIIVLLRPLLLSSCGGEWSSGGASVVAQIKVADRDEDEVVASIGDWLVQQGFREVQGRWPDVMGETGMHQEGLPRSRHARARMFSLEPPVEGRTFSWAIVRSAAQDPYVRVFNNIELVAGSKVELDSHEKFVGKVEAAFQGFITKNYR